MARRAPSERAIGPARSDVSLTNIAGTHGCDPAVRANVTTVVAGVSFLRGWSFAPLGPMVTAQVFTRECVAEGPGTRSDLLLSPRLGFAHALISAELGAVSW